jgi:hypothetical protein
MSFGMHQILGQALRYAGLGLGLSAGALASVSAPAALVPQAPPLSEARSRSNWVALPAGLTAAVRAQTHAQLAYTYGHALAADMLHHRVAFSPRVLVVTLCAELEGSPLFTRPEQAERQADHLVRLASAQPSPPPPFPPEPFALLDAFTPDYSVREHHNAALFAILEAEVLRTQAFAHETAALAYGIYAGLGWAYPAWAPAEQAVAYSHLETHLHEAREARHAELAAMGEQAWKIFSARDRVQVSPSGALFLLHRYGRGPRADEDDAVAFRYRLYAVDGKLIEICDALEEGIQFPVTRLSPGLRDFALRAQPGAVASILLPARDPDLGVLRYELTFQKIFRYRALKARTEPAQPEQSSILPE